MGQSQQGPATDARPQMEPNAHTTTPPGTFHHTPFPENTRVPSPAQNQRPETDHFPVQNPGSQNYEGSPRQQTFPGSGVAPAPPQLPQPQLSSPLYSQPPNPPTPVNTDLTHPELPPLRPVFGLSLEELLHRDGSAIPLLVYQCLQAVELFGLDVEGIYRLSGSAMHISKLRAIFDNGIALSPCKKTRKVCVADRGK